MKRMKLPELQTFETFQLARQVGSHSIWEELPDTLHICLVGILDRDQLAEIMSFQDEWSRDKPIFFILVNVKDLETVQRGARPVTKDDQWPMMRPKIVAVYGARFAVRTIGEMVLRARRLLGTVDPMPTKFFHSETDARKSIEALRRAIA